ncbi:MAG TPA: endolytic transglycosylase MltG, partial [Clostridia bacterium]|nr:endolytic transglycosylase MltG [Clostridia bacterium]
FTKAEPKKDSLEKGASTSSTPDLTGPEEPEEIKIIIPRGSTSKDIASILKNNGLIQSEEEFLDYSRARQLNSKLKAGEFLFHKGLSIEEITKILTE